MPKPLEKDGIVVKKLVNIAACISYTLRYFPSFGTKWNFTIKERVNFNLVQFGMENTQPCDIIWQKSIPEFFHADDVQHLLVALDELLVLRVLQLVLLDVRPHLLHDLGPGRRVRADDLGQLLGEIHRLREAAATPLKLAS